jgi:O-antigen/teichoic acid export membrane protein
MQSAISGVKWSSLSTIITSVLQIVQYTILAILLDPSAIGLVAIVTVVVGFAQVFADMGLSNAIIYRQDTARNTLSSLYWLNILAGVIIFILMLLLIPVIVAFYHEPRLYGLMLWASLIFLIMPLGQQFQVLLQKNLVFDSLAKIEITTAITWLAVSVALAFYGFGVISIVWGQLASAIVRAVQLAAKGWGLYRPELHFDLKDLDGYVNFGLYQMGERIVNYLTANIDVLLIGKFLGPGVLGLYSLALRLVLMPMQKINPVITNIAFPIFARYQHDNALLRAGYLKITQFVAFAGFPVLVGLAVTAQIYVPAIFGSQWSGAIPLIQILSIVGMDVALTNPSGSVYLAKGHADFGFRWNVVYMIMVAVVLFLTVGHGVIVMALSYACLSIFSAFLFMAVFRHMIGLSWGDYIGTLIKPLGINVLMGVLVYSTYLVLSSFGAGWLTLLAATILVGVASYGVLQLLFNASFVSQLKIFAMPGGRPAGKSLLDAR